MKALCQLASNAKEFSLHVKNNVSGFLKVLQFKHMSVCCSEENLLK
jgi:hypothetical protein